MHPLIPLRALLDPSVPFSTSLETPLETPLEIPLETPLL
jgi:hypothetical protein